MINWQNRYLVIRKLFKDYVIKLVKETSEHVCGEAERKGFIKNMLESRKNIS